MIVLAGGRSRNCRAASTGRIGTRSAATDVRHRALSSAATARAAAISHSGATAAILMASQERSCA